MQSFINRIGYCILCFSLKEKFLCLIFLTCRLKDDCSNPPGGLTLLKLSPLWKKGKNEKSKSLGAMAAREPPVEKKVKLK